MKLNVLIASACITFLCGCALQQDLLALNDRIIALEQRNSELEQQDAAARRESQRIQSRIENYSRTQEEKAQSLRNQSAEIQALFESFREDVQGLGGKLEEMEYSLRRQIKAIEDAGKNTGSRLSSLERRLNSGAFGTSAPRVPPQHQASPAPSEPVYMETRPIRQDPGISDRPVSEPKPRKQVGAGLSENELYALAKQAFDRNDFQTAREGFRQLIQAYPKSRRADNAQFWIGEIFYREKRYEEAILEYQEVIEKYPNGNKVKAALLKQGFAFFSLGDKANARLILQELVDRYPNSHEAKLAKDKLDWF